MLPSWRKNRGISWRFRKGILRHSLFMGTFFYDKKLQIAPTWTFPVYRRRPGFKISQTFCSASCFTPDTIMSSVGHHAASRFFLFRDVFGRPRAVHWEEPVSGRTALSRHLAGISRGRASFWPTGRDRKSTCSRRVPPPWACCDDEVLVVKSPEGRDLTPFPHLEAIIIGNGPRIPGRWCIAPGRHLL